MANHKKTASTKIIKRSTFSVVTLVATVFVFVIAGYYLLQNARQAGTSRVFINPSTVNVQAGNSFTVDVKDNTTTAVNGVITVVNYPANLLEVTNVDYTQSFYTKVTSSNTAGTVRSDMYYVDPVYCGPVPPSDHPGCKEGQLIDNNPAPTGEHLIHKITFRAKASGTAKITFGNGTSLLERGTATSVLGSSTEATVNISAAPSGTPTTTPSNTTKPSTSTTTKPGTSTSTTTKPSSTTPSSSSTSTSTNPEQTPAEESATGEVESGSIVPLSLTIVGSNGKPVSGAEVTIEGKTVKTDNSGLALFDNLRAGSYNAVVKYNGTEGSYPVEIAAGAGQSTQTIQLVAASNKLPIPFVALALGFLALSGVAILYIFGHKFLKKPHLEAAAEMAPVSDEATAKVQEAKPASDSSILSELESIQNTSVQPGSVIHPQEYSEHSIHHPDNQPPTAEAPSDDTKQS